MQHLYGKVLPSGVVNGDAAIDAAGDEEVTGGGVGDLLYWLVELAELVGDAGALDVEHAHHARLKTAREQRHRGVGRDAQGLVHRGGELIHLVHSCYVPQPDSLILRHCDYDSSTQVEV